MAENNDTNILDIVKAGKNIYDWGGDLASFLSTLGTTYAPAGSTLTSMLSDSSLASAMPFLGLAAFNLYNIFADKQRPAVLFSGSDPQYLWNGTTPWIITPNMAEMAQLGPSRRNTIITSM